MRDCLQRLRAITRRLDAQVATESASRTFLMHSYADQRTHDFFLNRDYPPPAHLDEVFRTLKDEARAVDELRAQSQLSEEEFDKALEKLEIHGGARVDFARQCEDRRHGMEENLRSAGAISRRAN